MTVNGLELGAKQDFLLIGGELIRLDGRHGLYLLAHGVGEGTHHTHLFASLIAVLLDARTGQNAIMLSVLHRTDGGNAIGAERGTRPYIVEGDTLRLCPYTTHYGSKRQDG